MYMQSNHNFKNQNVIFFSKGMTDVQKNPDLG